MKNFIWVTDIHLDWVLGSEEEDNERFKFFCEQINEKKPEAIIISGDISNSKLINKHLTLLERGLRKKIYFVLGNHDFHDGKISAVRKGVTQLNNGNLVYLTKSNELSLTENVAIVGHDGWYDCRYADWFTPGVVQMPEYTCVEEFREYALGSQSSMVSDPRIKIYGLMQTLATECAVHIKENLSKACEKHKTVIFVTHFPPFDKNAVYNGKVSDWRWMPVMSSKLAGDALLEIAKAYPNNNFVVLCGHSHGNAEYHPLPNLVCYTGKSDYKMPWVSIKELNI